MLRSARVRYFTFAAAVKQAAKIIMQIKQLCEAINIPRCELNDKMDENSPGKLIMVYFAAGFRSTAGSSIPQSRFNGTVKVFDLNNSIKGF